MEKKQFSHENSGVENLYTDRLQNIFHFFEQSSIDARLVGSFGRSSALGVKPSGFISEYQDYKDIDITILNENKFADQIMEEVRPLAQPFVIENHFSSQIDFQEDRSYIKFRDISERVDPSVFQMHIGNLFDQFYPTFVPQTQFHLTALYGYMRPKDLQNILRYGRQIRTLPHILPDEMFEAFHTLNKKREILYPKDTLLGDLRWIYHSRVPPYIRKSMAFITEPAWDALK